MIVLPSRRAYCPPAGPGRRAVAARARITVTAGVTVTPSPSPRL
jgi:hypothetical protein